MMRLRIRFSKTSHMRFTGHLDLHRTWERTFRRAGLPLAYSQGYNPRPKINLASALPLGFTSDSEVVDVWFEEELPPAEVAERLKKAAPPGLKINQVKEVDLRAATLQVALAAAEFIVTFLDPVDDLAGRVERLQTADSLPRERRSKPYDLRELIEKMEILPTDEEGRQRLYLRLTAQEGATGRPEEVADEMGIDPNSTRVHRTGLIFKDE